MTSLLTFFFLLGTCKEGALTRGISSEKDEQKTLSESEVRLTKEEDIRVVDC